MPILLYQLTIIGTLILTRILAPKRLQAVCLIWTVLTVVNLFWPPLIILQLLVIWMTFALIKPRESTAEKGTSGARDGDVEARADAASTRFDPSQRIYGESLVSNGAPVIEEGANAALDQPPSYAPSRIDFRFESPAVQTLIHPLPTNLADRAFTQADPSPRSEERREIEDTAIHLQVPLLAHFTRACNLESILEHGLRSIEKAQDAGIRPRVNDAFRLDGRPDAISVSIAFPNHRMFYSYRQRDPEEEWVVLLIDPAILWMKSCGFCQRNASDHRVRALPLPGLMDASAFRSMFDPVDDLPTRQEQKLMDFDPTDPQAEVLVFDTIEPRFIEGIAFDSQEVQTACAHLVGDRRCAVFDRNTGPFASRGYARKWSN
ncbi:DarT ssDNA thymidine ADP-ribosyltransferase family protein [Caballeronia telluris]|uniref:DarT domain-containing protein n=1 Tax=Caballeronia telluris TaxID=326475 RepID=A0A158K8F2_9BURK|nr:DarT ssDNA thymidine ADP-ribosyltransferase family protein [Caballeronia telluris]SAL77396.1 hypothetical protein AWB66_05617 [Caballeronia telluris]